MTRAAAVLLLLSICHWVWAGSVYRWQDDQGRWHFSDREPEQGKAENIGKPADATNLAEGGDARKRLNALFPKETDAEKAYRQQQRRENQQQQRDRHQRCDNARQHLEALRGPVVFRQEDGSYQAVSEQERARRERQLAQKINRFCN